MDNYYYRKPSTDYFYSSVQKPLPNISLPQGQPQQWQPQQRQPQQNNGLGIASAAAGAAQIGGDIYAANQEANSIQTQSPELQTIDEFGTPVYNLGSQAEYINSLNERNYGRGLGIKGLATGASAGASFGVPGAIIGAGIGLVSGLLGRFGARKKARNKIKIAKSNYRRAQQDFNEANLMASQNRLAREQYNDMLGDPYGLI